MEINPLSARRLFAACFLPGLKVVFAFAQGADTGR